MKIAELVKQEIPILEYAKASGMTPKKVGLNEYTLLEHDSVRIETVNNSFYRHSTGQGGSIIDFAMMVHQVDNHKAMGLLRDYLHNKKPCLAAELPMFEGFQNLRRKKSNSNCRKRSKAGSTVCMPI